MGPTYDFLRFRWFWGSRPRGRRWRWSPDSTGVVSTTFLGQTPLGGAGGCLLQVMTVLGFSTTGKTMVKVSARSDYGKCSEFQLEVGLVNSGSKSYSLTTKSKLVKSGSKPNPPTGKVTNPLVF